MENREAMYTWPEYWLERIQNDIFRMVHEYQEAHNLNQSQLAEKLGVSKGYISQILNGNFNFSLKKLIELALKLNVAPQIDLSQAITDYTVQEEERLTLLHQHGFVKIHVHPRVSFQLPIEQGRESDQKEVQEPTAA